MSAPEESEYEMQDDYLTDAPQTVRSHPGASHPYGGED